MAQACYAVPDETVILAARQAQIFSNGDDRFFLCKLPGFFQFYMMTAEAPASPTAENSGLPWTIADAGGGPEVWHPQVSYQLYDPVLIQEGTTIHVFYLLRFSTFSTHTLCHIEFDMTTKTWGDPDETGPSWSYVFPGDGESPILVSGSLVGADKFALYLYLQKTTGGGSPIPYTTTMYLVRKDAGVWGSPVAASTTGTNGSDDLISGGNGTTHYDSGSGLLHLFWLQNGGTLHADPYNSSYIVKTRSYNVSGSSFNAIQDIIAYDPVAARENAPIERAKMPPIGAVSGTTFCLPFRRPISINGAAVAPAYAAITGNPGTASPTWTVTNLGTVLRSWMTVPRAITTSDNTIHVVMGVFEPNPTSGLYSQTACSLKYFSLPSGGAWTSEQTLFNVNNGLGYPPASSNIQMTPQLQIYGLNAATSNNETRYPLRIHGYSEQGTEDVVCLGTDSTQDPAITAIFPIIFGDVLQASDFQATYTMVADTEPCPDCPEGTDITRWSDPLDTTIRFVHGDTYPFLATITVNGTPFNLTGCTLRFTAKWKWTDADASALIVLDNGGTGGITVTDAANGIIQVKIPKTATQDLPYYELRLVYDIQLYDTNADRYTPMRGTLIVLPDSTRALT